jgi:hypothetical protein
MPLNQESKFKSLKTRYKSIPKWVRAVIIILLSLLLLLVLAWFVLAWYISNHKKELLAKITTEVSENIDGNFHIVDMEPAMLKGFPNISVRLKGVTLSDSMYSSHKRNLIDLQSVYIKLNVWSLLTRHPEVMKVTIADGTIYLFSDKNGYSNTYLFKKKNQQAKPKKGKEVDINKFGIENVTFTFDHFERNKQFKVAFKEMNGIINTTGDVLDINAETQAHIYQLGFNLEKGGFVKDKDLDANLHILFNKKTKDLRLPKQTVAMNGTNIKVGCIFHFGNKPANYTIDIDAPSIGFKESTSFLSRHIAKKLDSFDLEKNFAVQVTVNGSFQYPDTPLIHARWQAQDNVLVSSFGKMEKTDLKGEFYNNFVAGKGLGDDNSAVTITTLKASFSGINFKADSIVVYGLINPLMKLKLVSQFPVERLNTVLDNTFDLKGGQADVNLNYTGPILATDTFRHTMFGHIRLKDVALTYVPRNLAFQKCNVNIEFMGNDLILHNTTLSSRNSTLKIDGTARNFMNVYFLDPGMVNFDWNISSSLIDLNEFKSFLAPRKKRGASRKKQNHKIARISDRLQLLLEKSNMFLHVNVNKLTYRHFDAQNIKADLDLTQDAIQLHKASLQHAGGTVTVSGGINQQNPGNPFQLKAKINSVEVNKLFYAFENFGVQALNSNNLQGSISADIDVTGGMQESGAIIKNSMNGKVNFILTNGALVNFAPLLSIQKYAFKKRNLSNITFKTLKNDLSISRGKITINPMEIESSAIRMKIQGVYAFDKGTDISMEIPLRNPKKDQDLIEKGLEPKKKKGIIIYLRAMDGDDGKVKISWDPFKKGVKDEKEEPMFEEEEDAAP